MPKTEPDQPDRHSVMPDTNSKPETPAIGEAELKALHRQLQQQHETIRHFEDPESGLQGIIAIHDTTLGPGLGGVRMWPYDSPESALEDVKRLSRGMTYKAAVAGLEMGGGKAVIIGNPETDRSEPLFRAFGRQIDKLGGRYLTAKDVGVTVRDLEWIGMETPFVTGLPEEKGGSGDPSLMTAFGVYMGMKAAAKVAWGSDSLEGRSVAIQGAGHVGHALAGHLADEGARIAVADINGELANRAAKEHGAEVVPPSEIGRQGAQIFSPCALGGVINDHTIGELTCEIVAGGANNILQDEEKHGEALRQRDILYAPDYVLNAGGIINISFERGGYDPQKARAKTEEIYNTVLLIFLRAGEQGIPTHQASARLAEERIWKERNRKK
ncbi:MAG: Glu/Leu/Phe/Val dehydrogenase dimerization domain-containing protein [Balneolaceae bacterium]